MKTSAQVVVIGGGVVGASVLYHLTKAGWTDVAQGADGGVNVALSRGHAHPKRRSKRF